MSTKSSPIKASDLLKKVQFAASVISRQPVIPILEYVCFRNNTIQATNLEQFHSIDHKGPGGFCVEAKDLVSTLKTLKAQEITYELEGDRFVVAIVGRHNRFKLAIQKEEDFPKEMNPENDIITPTAVVAIDDEAGMGALRDALKPITQPDDNVDVNAAAQQFADNLEKMKKNGKIRRPEKPRLPSFTLVEPDKDTINGALLFVGRDELRPAMLGVYISHEHICATNGNILLFKDTISKFGVDKPFILPATTARHIVKLAGDLKVDYSTHHARFRASDRTICCRLINERFPDYKAAIPPVLKWGAIFGAEVFMNTINYAMPYTNPYTKQINMWFKDKPTDNVRILAENFDEQKVYEDTLTCEYQGPDDYLIAFNSNLMQDAFKALGSPDVLKFQWQETDTTVLNRPMILNGCVLLMPIIQDDRYISLGAFYDFKERTLPKPEPDPEHKVDMPDKTVAAQEV